MKRNVSENTTVPVPRRVYGIVVLVCMIIGMASAAAGMATAPERQEIPVVLSNGDIITPPWYIMVDGEKAALVASEEAAEKTISRVIEEYKGDETKLMDIKVLEKTVAEKMDIRSGDAPPDILTVAEAEQKLMEGRNGEGYLTVVTTQQETEQEPIAFQQEYKPDASLYVGEKKVAVEGEEGVKEVTKKVVKENGEPVQEEILEEEVVKEPVQELVLTGTKGYDAYGGGDGSSDEGVSYEPEADYDVLQTPIDSVYVSSGYGQRWGRMHRGTDFALAEGNEIHAADGGTVYFADVCGGYGNLVKIDHGNGMQTYYAHCSELLVAEGQQVECGETIALVGNTGNSTGPHLHFEVIINGKCVDPMSFIDLP